MNHRLLDTPINNRVRTFLRVAVIFLMCFLMLANHQGYLVPISDWIEIHVPTWLAIADMIIASSFPFVLSLIPQGSEAEYLADSIFTPFALIATPCSKKAPSFFAFVAWISVLYFMIRWGFFYDSLPRLKKPDDWEEISASMSHATAPPDNDDRYLKIVIVIFIAAFLIIKSVTLIAPAPTWLAFTDITTLCIGAAVISRLNDMKSLTAKIAFSLVGATIPILRSSLQVVSGRPISAWTSLGIIAVYCTLVIIAWRFYHRSKKNLPQDRNDTGKQK